MQTVLLAICVVAAVAYWHWRTRVVRESAGEVSGPTKEARAAARRFSYRRRENEHPADSVEDARLAASGIALAIASIDSPLSRAELDEMHLHAARTFDVSDQEAREIAAFGRWVAGQCQTPEDAVRRLTKVVLDQAGTTAGSDLVRIVEDVATADGNELGERETRQLDHIKRSFDLA